MEVKNKQAFAEYLSQFVTEHKFNLMQKVLQNRTNHVTVVLEDIYQPQNASAVLRTCDCMGVQSVHIIENKNKYELNPDVELGAAKWLNLHKYSKRETNNTVHCLQHLKQQGYRIVATTPHTHSCSIQELPIDGKFAVVFGTEKDGISQTVHEMADEFVVIPMHGFTESYNISVSAAITLYELTTRMRNSKVDWKLKPEEHAGILVDWLKGSIKRPDLIEKDYLEKLERALMNNE
jgi:tRNA (guanosine-2'-O-)-methyltransferase